SDEPLASVARWIDSNGIDSLQMLTIIDPLLDIVGSDLAYAYSTFDQQGAPAVAFNLTDLGSGRFRALTTQNAPSGTRKRQLGIVLDDVLLSAPSINEPIAKEGRITGNFTREEVDRLVAILKAGQLPAALTPQPIAENQIGATLGADTIRKGVIAIAVSLALVLLFILFYYRFAGVLACLALTLNLAMILGTMVLINQPLTLPGLAGLVLTVGMSVDANVLIFERIREELKKGAKPRMAIRNGFSKATTTIVDANLTTLITAIVLYAIGTDQIRGFAVTLILGIAYSMFTAIFMSRTLFDIAERHGFVSLSMADTINSLKNAVSGGAQFDFIGKGKFSLAVSLLLVMAGVGALFARGQGILDIDFAGGASVQFRLTEKTDTETVREIVKKALTSEDGEPVQSTVTSVSMESAPDGTVYKADASIEDVERMKELLETGFAADGELKLMTYEVSVEPTPPPGNAQVPSFDDALLGGQRPNDGRQFAVAYAQEDAAEGEADSTSPAAGESTETNSDVDAGAGEESSLEESGAVLTAGQTTTSYIRLGVAGTDEVSTINAKTLIAYVRAAAEAVGVSVSDRSITLSPIGEGADKWERKSSLQFSQWQIDLPLEKEVADKVTEQLQSTLSSDAVWISSSRVGSQVASDMVGRAMGALFGSILCIIAYIWFRFQRVIYGFAAVAALLHDVLITLGAIAVSFYVADVLGFLLIDRFKISLTVVAALLTIIGYSLNDTIVVFDRIRETKGKAPRLTAEMINSSINQTLSRTLLTSITTLIVVLLLYLFGGSGIHAFAFALVIGVLVGTYSSIFVASPILLWLVKRNETASN
ncbi:MAG: protein translocase subunit SecD, partial [Planctomycetota bacterium]